MGALGLWLSVFRAALAVAELALGKARDGRLIEAGEANVALQTLKDTQARITRAARAGRDVPSGPDDLRDDPNRRT